MGASLIALPAFAAPANLKLLDPDSDGTVSLAEAQAAGVAKLKALDPDATGRSTPRRARAPSSISSAADPDKDGTVDKAEYAAEIAAAFKKADPDGDGTLDAAELCKPCRTETARPDSSNRGLAWDGTGPVCVLWSDFPARKPPHFFAPASNFNQAASACARAARIFSRARSASATC